MINKSAIGTPQAEVRSPSSQLPLPSWEYQEYPTNSQTVALARNHTASVLDTDWSLHSDMNVVSGSEDGNMLIWQVDPNAFKGWNLAMSHINASPRKVG
ncbi:hypothetical protein BGY98DRAFT_1095088 [Russula aff. rugulosa BPL654]|nr:hypothetical protein BGY98DRAFT_1095088 [Russula aff. rugulosa BPL654]